MSGKRSSPFLRNVWIVIHESEGLIPQAFTKRAPALARAKQLAKKYPTTSVEVANYLIALNSRRCFEPQEDEEEE